jgi:hypothetical protein
VSRFLDVDYEAPEAADLRAEARVERRRVARLRHWCSECLGFTGSGSPCALEPDEEPEDEIDEQDVDACGKELP